MLGSLGRLKGSLRRNPLPFGRALAALAAGCERALLGDPEEAAALLRESADRFEAIEMGLWASAARYRRGCILDDDEGSQEIAAATAWMRRRGVEDPERVAQVLAPGLA